ncbi:MAG: HpcH/HpaI aldolase/citrate lyase family protein [Qipengyuania sp.]
MRSWLVTPAENEKALSSVSQSGADVVAIDLARGLGEQAQAAARIEARDWLAAQMRQVLAQKRFSRWVRIGGIAGPYWREDLAAVMQGEPEGIILSDADSPEHIRELAAVIYELEQHRGIAHNSTRIVPQLGGSAQVAFTIGQFASEVHPRVSGLTWDATALARALGARRTRGPGAAFTDAMAHVRAQVLLAAHANGLDAVDSPWRDARDAKGARTAADAARADGFSGMVAIHPAQVPLINEAFRPTSEERAEAQEIIGAFASNPHAEVLPLKGRRIGAPQLARAKRLLAG